MKNLVGVIGITGRIGSLLAHNISNHDMYSLGASYSRTSAAKDKEEGGSKPELGTLSSVFAANDYVVDFSSPALVPEVLAAALENPKPLIIGTTGWQKEIYQREFIDPLSQRAPVIIAPNTSMGACLQVYLARQLAGILGSEFDIDISEKHHRHKKDIPSGTAKNLLANIISTKEKASGLKYTSYPLRQGPRPENFINVNVERSGNLPGEHEICFTSAEEVISIKHVALNRGVFVAGVIKALNWLKIYNPPPRVYEMTDIFDFQEEKKLRKKNA